MTTAWEEPPVKESEEDYFISQEDWAILENDLINLQERVLARENYTGGTTDFPIGGVIPFHGYLADIPEGFALCDGYNGLPDMRNVIPFGASNDDQVGYADGAVSHLHTNSDTGHAGAHSHTYSFITTTSGSSLFNGVAATSVAHWSHYHTKGSASLSDSDHDHGMSNTGFANSMPPYKKLFFIGRIS